VITFRRHKLTEVVTHSAFGPRPTDAPGLDRDACPACNQLFVPGDYTTLVPLGPGDDEEYQERAREGRWFNAVSIEVHYACATGRSATLADAVDAEENKR